MTANGMSGSSGGTCGTSGGTGTHRYACSTERSKPSTRSSSRSQMSTCSLSFQRSWSLSGPWWVVCCTLYVSTITSRSFLGVSSTFEARKRHVVATCGRAAAVVSADTETRRGSAAASHRAADRRAGGSLPESVHSARTTPLRKSGGRRRWQLRCSAAACEVHRGRRSNRRLLLDGGARRAFERGHVMLTGAAAGQTLAGRRTSPGGTPVHGSSPCRRRTSLRSRRVRASCRSPRATCTRVLHARSERPGWAPSMKKKRHWKPSGQRPARARGLPSAARGLENMPRLETRIACPFHGLFTGQVKSSLLVDRNNRQSYGSLSNVLRKPAVEDGSRWRWADGGGGSI